MRFLKYIFCALLFVTASVADTININWMDGNTTYAQTTCEIGGDIILPEPPTKRGYTFKGWVAGYTRLEYIESTGTQYIDTSIKTSSNHGLHIKFAKPVTTGDVIVIGTKNIDNARWGLNPTSTMNIQFGNHFTSSYVSIQVNFVYDVKVNYLNDRRYHINDFVDRLLEEVTFTNTYNAYLCAGSWGSKTASLFFTGKVYFSIITENYNIVQHLIPAKRNLDNAIGMYDTVSRQFFTNAGTGEFIAGPVAENQNFYE